jgi:hypothetical protein
MLPSRLDGDHPVTALRGRLCQGGCPEVSMGRWGLRLVDRMAAVRSTRVAWSDHFVDGRRPMAREGPQGRRPSATSSAAWMKVRTAAPVPPLGV